MFYSQLCKQKCFLTLSVNYCVRSLQYILGTKCSKFCDCKRNPAMLPMRLNHFSTFFSMVLFVFPFCYKTPKKIFGIVGRMSINAPLNVRSKVKALPGGERGGGGVLRISSDGDDRMGAKIKAPKNPQSFQHTQQHHWTKHQSPQKSNSRKTSLIVFYSQNYAAGIRWHYHESSDCFEYSPKIPT